MRRPLKYNTLLAFVIAIGFVSCSNDNIAPLSYDNGAYMARIDLAIEGGIDQAYSIEGNEDVMTLGYGQYESLEASVINLEIARNETVELIIRNAAIDQPLHVPFLYSAFSELVLPMRDTYVIANFYYKGELTYSSTAGNAAEDHIQTFVLEIIDTDDQSLMARFHDMQLFPVHNNLLDRAPIRIRGTFSTTF